MPDYSLCALLQPLPIYTNTPAQPHVTLHQWPHTWTTWWFFMEAGRSWFDSRKHMEIWEHLISSMHVEVSEETHWEHDHADVWNWKPVSQGSATSGTCLWWCVEAAIQMFSTSDSSQRWPSCQEHLLLQHETELCRQPPPLLSGWRPAPGRHGGAFNWKFNVALTPVCSLILK